ncbi:AlwI family type II restriction endonuclease [Fructobacillus sp. M158]|uniref:AlwI family type II restriction endonuclease n=1 Tax=Fructobacillus parabroussonetiae TaxID=2713174 RepID=UPI00200B5B7C|nr:AlwI family type II restriction endonuclease [Fructobacillus parabroussonetiae]MCK8617999.1 AlwI family type II restriction endonuclease [Fructobacillus parabroussonetiae]
MSARRFEKKALLLATTVRNPERFPAFLAALKPFDGTVFNETVARKVAQTLIRIREYSPDTAIKTVNELQKYKGTDEEMTDEDALTAVRWALENLSGHGVGGFQKKSWGGRTVEWFGLMQELGAVRIEKDKEIKFSASGNDMARVYSDESVQNADALVENFWLNGMMKLQPKSPFRSGTIENRPFVLMLDVILRLAEKFGPDEPGLSRAELSFLLNWDGSDAQEFLDYILDIRDRYGKQLSSDLVYDLVMNDDHMLKGEPETRFKKPQIVQDIVDDWMRKSRMTGIIQLRGLGRYLDILPEEEDKARYIVKHYNKFNDEMDVDKYFASVATFDENIRFAEAAPVVDHIDEKMKTINQFAKGLSWDEVVYELSVLNGGRKSSKHDLLKLIRDPLRFEFLSAIATRKSFPNALIEANYSADDEGLPKSTAIGDTPDLFVKDTMIGATIEVTLQTSKSQATNEIPAISRHLAYTKQRDGRDDYFTVFVAKALHPDSVFMAEFAYARDQQLISTYGIDEFATKMAASSQVIDLKKEPAKIFTMN